MIFERAGRKMSWKIVQGLLLYVLAVSMIASLFGWPAGYSALLGSGIAALATSASIWVGFRFTANPGIAALNVIRSEVAKYSLAAVSMALVFKFVASIEEIIFFSVMFIGFLVAPCVGYYHEAIRKQRKVVE
jgi:F0F1-type ATP synthase assembly protein I